MPAKSLKPAFLTALTLTGMACQGTPTSVTVNNRETVTNTRTSPAPSAKASPSPSAPASTSPVPFSVASAAPSISPSPSASVPPSATPEPSVAPSASLGPSASPTVSVSPSTSPTPAPSAAPSVLIQNVATAAFTLTSLAGGQLSGTQTSGTGDDAYIKPNSGAVGMDLIDFAQDQNPTIFFSNPDGNSTHQVINAGGLMNVSGLVGFDLKTPRGLCYDAAAKVVYATDAGHHRVIRVGLTGNTFGLSPGLFEAVAGSKTTDPATITYGEGETRGASPLAFLHTPNAVARLGNWLYVLDAGFHTVSRIELTGNYPLSFVAGGKSTTGGAAVAGPVAGSEARFRAPGAMCAGKRDGQDVLYVADTGNHCIRMVVPDSDTVTTVAGSLTGVKGHDDGVGTAARFDTPVAVTADHEGNLYVGELGTPRLRRIAADGTTSTLAGGLSAGFVDGDASTARLGAVLGLAARLDASGKMRALYVFDNGTPTEGVRLRVLTPTP